MKKSNIFSGLIFCTLFHISLGAVALHHLSTTYMPVRYNPGPVYEYDKEAAEQLAYDPSQKHIYNVGVNLLHVIDISNPTAQQVVYYTSISVGNITDVEVCGQFFAITIDNYQRPLEGKLYIYRLYNPSNGKLEKVKEITVGAVPDMLKFSHDCKKILIAIEGEVRIFAGSVIDPEGGVGIVEFDSSDLAGNYQYRVADFTAFNPRAEEYVTRGVRWVWRGENAGIPNTFSQDMEPEYIALNKDDTKAYVCLQENNAIAVVDVASATVQEIYPLGWKPWKDSGLDASDRDNDVNIQSWDVYGMYQPDTIKYITIQGKDYILTANEGDYKKFEGPDFPFEWDESKRGRDFSREDLIDSSVDQNLQDQLAENAELGRLKFTTTSGKTQTGTYNNFFAFGGRGISLFNSGDLSLVWDSGKRLEQDVSVSAETNEVFNSNAKDAALTPEVSKDGRSDNMGPEAESTTVGEINGKTYVFAGIERPGIIVIYSVPTSGPINLVYEGIHYAGGLGESFENLWDQRIARDLDPEDIRFIPASDSPSNTPLLLVAGSVSGTVSLYSIQINAEDSEVALHSVHSQKPGSSDNAGGATVPSVAIAAICLAGLALIISGMVVVVTLKKKNSHLTSSESSMNLPNRDALQNA